MAINLLIQIVIILLLIPLWIQVYLKYKYTSGIFFLFFSIITSLWLLLYTLVFSNALNQDTLLVLNRLMYFLSLVGIYNMLFFVGFFRTKIVKYKRFKFAVLWFMLGIFLVTLFTPYILESVTFSNEKQRYIENYGVGYNIFTFLYILFLPLFILASYFKVRSLNSLEKTQLAYVIIGFFILVSLWITYLTILPLFWVHMLDENVIFIIIPFLIFTGISIHSFKFINHSILITRIISFFFSACISVFTVSLIKNYYIQYEIWETSKDYNIADLILIILLFYWINSIINSRLFYNKWFVEFSNSLAYIKKQLTYIHNIDEVNTVLTQSFKKFFWIQQAYLILWNIEKHPLKTFFKEVHNTQFFVNEASFIHKFRNKIDSIALKKELINGEYLILPLYKNKKIIGLFCIGKKQFKDYFFMDEINALKDFCSFLETHLKYLESFKKVHELSVNLDKQVDKQTFEYNQLINKQKEFINMISHEVKGPIASSIFQIDTIIEDFEEGTLKGREMEKELHILNDLLLKTWDLVNKLFSIQQFEMNTKSLFKEEVKIVDLLQNELNIFEKLHPHIDFRWSFDTDIWYITLDKVQFRQVIDNLINNAVKVIDKKKWKIYISCHKIKNNLLKISIEDNGKWFTDIEIENIFEKYSTGKSSSVWLWMGLYLCKTIVDMHWWNIQASFGKKLWWAKIIITIPCET